MAVLPIRIYPDPVLREPAAAVSELDESIAKLVADMRETMYAAPGIGLAAPQVGVQRRVLVYQVGEEAPFNVLVNPEIVSSDGEQVDDEGCLSIPGLTYPVTRAERVRVRAIDAEGAEVDLEVADLEARVVQHEIDHLDGVLFIHRLSGEMRREALRLIRERALEGATTPVPWIGRAGCPSTEIRRPDGPSTENRRAGGRSTEIPAARI